MIIYEQNSFDLLTKWNYKTFSYKNNAAHFDNSFLKTNVDNFDSDDEKLGEYEAKSKSQQFNENCTKKVENLSSWTWAMIISQ